MKHAGHLVRGHDGIVSRQIMLDLAGKPWARRCFPVPCDILSFMRAFLAGIAARDCLRPWLYAVAFFVTT